MKWVNYGAPARTQRTDYPSGGYMVSAVHDGPDNHHLLQPGEQCECGQLGIGIIRAVRDYQLFFENFETITSSGIDFADGEEALRRLGSPRWLAEALAFEDSPSRWRRFLRWIGHTPRPRWKPCVQIDCPPLEEHTINWTGPAHDYVPGSFAREAAAFYAEQED